MKDAHRSFLIELDANKTAHSGRTLFEHLKGVHDLLRDWGNDEDVCLAGLYHSIYGTNTFKHQSLHDRAQLVAMIGEHAEFLVHCFATQDRPLFESIDDPVIRVQLLEIETANLYEQGGNDRTLGKLLRQKVSSGAKATVGGVVR
jgi:hypothetical protein